MARHSTNPAQLPTDPEQWHPMKVVMRTTGLGGDLLRAWERRYQAVSPRRAPSGHRLYSSADLERLRLLRRLTACGRSIGQIAHLTAEQLRTLLHQDEARGVAAPSVPERPTAATRPAPAAEHLADALAAARSLDPAELDRRLAAASLALGPSTLVEDVLLPLLRRLGELWHSGEIRIAHEHAATAVVRTALATLGRSEETGAGPGIVVATPAGQMHELGALAVAATAVREGWRPTFLGASVPAEDLAVAVRETGARAIALSLVYPPDDPHLHGELRRLRRLLGPDTSLLLGGAAAPAYGPLLGDVGAEIVPDLIALRRELGRVRADRSGVRRRKVSR